MQYIIRHARKAHTEFLGQSGIPAVQRISAVLQASENACLLAAAVAEYTGESNSHPDPDIDSTIQEIRSETMDVRRLVPLAIMEIIFHMPMPYTRSFNSHYESLCISAGQLCRSQCPDLLQELDDIL